MHEGAEMACALQVGEDAGALRPESHFDTIACRAARRDDLPGGIAALAGGRACRIVTPETARRLVGSLASEGPVSGDAAPAPSCEVEGAGKGANGDAGASKREVEGAGAGEGEAEGAGPVVARPLAIGACCDAQGRPSCSLPASSDAGECEASSAAATRLRLRATPLRQQARELREAAGGDALLVADDSLANPWLCRPLAMGFDAVVEDLRPWLGLDACAIIAGSEDVLARVLACAGVEAGEPAEAGVDAPTRMGELGGDPAAWDRALERLALTSLCTQRRCDTALAVAHYLVMHPAVAWVSYPGLPDDPANDAARRVLEHGFGSRLTFGLVGERAAAAALCEAAGHVPGQAAAGPCGRRVGETPLSPTLVEALGEGDALLLRAGLETPLDVVQTLEGLLAPLG